MENKIENPFFLIIWDKSKKRVLNTYHLHSHKPQVFGRNKENALSLNHEDLSPFHVCFSVQDSFLLITPIPGSPKLRPFGPRKNLFGFLRTPSTLKVSKKGGRYFYKNLVFEIVGPDQMIFPKWPQNQNKIIPAPKFQIQIENPKLTLFQKKGLGFTFLFLFLLTFGFWINDPNHPPKANGHLIQANLLQPQTFPLPILSTNPIPELDPPSLPTPNIIPSSIEKRVIPPLRLKPKSLSTPLQKAKKYYLHGQEKKAISLLLRTHEQKPLSQMGTKSAQLAKYLERLRILRKKIQKHGESNQITWEQYIGKEKALLQSVSQKTLHIASFSLAKEGNLSFQKGNFVLARRFWDLALRWNPNQSLAQKGLQDLENKADKNFQKAYLLIKIDNLRAKRLLEITLAFVPEESLVAKKVKKLLDESKHSS